MQELFQYSFIKHAVAAAILSSIVCGLIGTIIVEKRLVSMSGGIAHTAFGGIGLGYLLGIEPIFGGLIFSILASLGIASIKRKTNTNADALVGIFWAFGMGLGILFIALTPGYAPDMTSYLFGNILTVSRDYISIMIILTSIIVLLIIGPFHYWRMYLFDEEFAFVKGLPVVKMEYILFILISLSIVILIKVVGIILAIALLTIPPAISKIFIRNYMGIMILSAIIGIVLSMAGLYLSYLYDIPSGSSIILVSAISYIVIVAGRKLVRIKN